MWLVVCLAHEIKVCFT